VKQWGEGLFKWAHGVRVDRNGVLWATEAQEYHLISSIRMAKSFVSSVRRASSLTAGYHKTAFWRPPPLNSGHISHLSFLALFRRVDTCLPWRGFHVGQIQSQIQFFFFIRIEEFPTGDLLAIKEALDEFGKVQRDYVEIQNRKFDELKATNAVLRDRIEEIESRKNLPGKTRGNGAPEYKVFHTSAGDIYEIPHNVKMVDALPPEKQPEISFERRLGCGSRRTLPGQESTRIRARPETTRHDVNRPSDSKSIRFAS
jgi:hypothetical protein